MYTVHVRCTTCNCKCVILFKFGAVYIQCNCVAAYYSFCYVSLCQEEELELAEFEQLEKAAMESSFSSQCSLLPLMPGNNEAKLSSEPSSLSTHTSAGETSAVPSVEEEHPLGLGPVSTSEGHHMKQPASKSSDQPAPHSYSNAHVRVPLPSLAAGMEFGDDEAWESFNSGTPNSCPVLNTSSGSSNCTPVPSPVPSPRSKKDGSSLGSVGMNPCQYPQQPLLRKVAVLPDLPEHANRPHASPERSSHILPAKLFPPSTVQSPQVTPSNQPLSKPPVSSSQEDITLPPPSALVAKLFPSLRKDREASRAHTKQQVLARPLDVAGSHVHGEREMGGRGEERATESMSEQLRQKLALLESEIERFRSENAALERLRHQKEEVHVYIQFYLYMYVIVYYYCCTVYIWSGTLLFTSTCVYFEALQYVFPSHFNDKLYYYKHSIT